MPPLSWVRTVWKQKTLLAVIWLVLSAIAVAVVYSLPAIYKADVVILVESQRIPQSFVASTVNADLRDRLSNLSQQILSYTRLLEIIKKFGLYTRQRPTHVEEEIVQMMRSDIDIQLEKGWSQERPGAFRISYRGPNPNLDAMVANQLGNLFIEENLRAREVQAVGTSEFLDSQLEEAKKRLEEQESKLSQFKLKYNGELPEQENALLAKLNQLQVQLQGVQDSAARAQQSKVMLDTSLRLAQDSLATLTEMAQSAAGSGGDSAGSGGQATRKLSEQLEDQLKALRSMYTENHPDVIRTKRLLELARQAEAEENEALETKTDDPKLREASEKKQKSRSLLVSQNLQRERDRVEQLKSQDTVASKQIADYERERQQILRDIASLKGRLDQLPVREQEMASVTRDYEISKANYQSLLDKKLAAEMAADMERRQKAERFTMLDPARVPEKPYQPDRPLFSALACVVSLVLAAGVVAAREMRRGVFLGEWELPAGELILARLPVIRTGSLGPRRGFRTAVLTTAVLSLLGAIAGTIIFALRQF